MADNSYVGAQNKATQDVNSGKPPANTTNMPADTASAYNARYDWAKAQSEKK